MNRGQLSFVLKLAVAFAIVGFLVATGRLSLAPLHGVLAHPATCVALIALQLVILLLGVVRWWLILRAIEGHGRSLLGLFAYTWVGQFIGCVAPSAVATDIVRYRYLRQASAALPAPVLTSILVDRLCGITSISLLALVFAPRVLVTLVSGERAWLLLAIVAAIVLAAMFAVRFGGRLRIAGHIERTRTAWRAALATKSVSVVAIAIGFVAHALKVLSLWLIVRAVTPSPLSLATVFSFAPVGFVFEALPLAPGGLGTAHLVFDYLFRGVGLPDGAGVFNVYFILRMCVNLGGGVVWLATGRRSAPTPE